MKRLLSGFVCLAMLLTLSACSSGGKSGTSSKSTGTPTDLTVQFIITGSQPADLQAVQDAVNKIVTPAINAKITMQMLNFGNSQQQQNLMLSSGEKLDLMITFPNTFTNLVAHSQVQDITSYYNKYGSGIKSALGKYIQAGYVNGKLYGVHPVTEGGCGAGIVIRKDIVDKYNIDTSKIKTLDDIGNMFATIKKNEPNQAILGLSHQNQGLYEMYSQCVLDRLGDGFGVLMDYGQNLKVVDMYETTEYASFVKLMHDWYQKGYIIKDIDTNKDNQYSLVKSGKAYGYFVPTKPSEDLQESAQDGYQMDCIQIGKAFACTNIVWEWVVPTACKTPDKAVQMLNLMFTNADLENLLAYGVENKDYVKKSDGTIDFPTGQSATNSGYYLGQPWMMGNEDLMHVWTGYPTDYWKQSKTFADSCTFSKAFGFNYDPTNVKSEITALTNIYSQYKMGLEGGTVDPNTVLPQFISKLKSAGIDKVVSEKQKQLDAWSKSKSSSSSK